MSLHRIDLSNLLTSAGPFNRRAVQRAFDSRRRRLSLFSNRIQDLQGTTKPTHLRRYTHSPNISQQSPNDYHPGTIHRNLQIDVFRRMTRYTNIRTTRSLFKLNRHHRSRRHNLEYTTRGYINNLRAIRSQRQRIRRSSI